MVFPLKKSHQRPKRKARRPLIRHKDTTIQDTVMESTQNNGINGVDEEESNEDKGEGSEIKTVNDLDTLDAIKTRIALLEHEKQQLEQKITIGRFGVERFALSGSDMQFYTGLDNYLQFKALFDFLDGNCCACSRLNYWGSNNCNFQLQDLEKRGKKRSIIPADELELFLTLSRLRANVPEKVLADQFKISTSEVSRIFVTWVDLLFSRLNQLPIWATRETLNPTMPESFKCDYPYTRIILDCTEIFIEKPSCFRVQAETYSTYKSHNTAKGLVGIAPNGAVTFISDLYGGHVSDRKIVIASGILDMLEPHDSVMPDSGFESQDLLVPKKVSLNIPPFMRCKDQLDPDEEDETRQIAAVRIHVERAIERIKNYNILKQIIPNSMAEDLNKILKVSSYLTNLKGPLVV
ncbi:uncharacterized protein [Montipora capricornis]|uniref:uncharacterized protein n=1 Tax=Montipora capricornis TaxID=246305 RepID=UPI0035F14975